MRILARPVKIGWAISKWSFLVTVVASVVSSLIALVLLGLWLLVKSVNPELLGPLEAWSLMLLIVGFLATFIYAATLAGNRAFEDVVRADRETSS